MFFFQWSQAYCRSVYTSLHTDSAADPFKQKCECSAEMKRRHRGCLFFCLFVFVGVFFGVTVDLSDDEPEWGQTVASPGDGASLPVLLLVRFSVLLIVLSSLKEIWWFVDFRW